MLFVVEYNRQKGELVHFQRYENINKAAAQKKRFELELEQASNGLGHEIVLLEAENEEALHLTHGRYFGNLRSLVKAALE